MVLGCLKCNPTNNFYRHNGAILVGTSDIIIGSQKLIENLYEFYL